MTAPPIVLLTDFGLSDAYVGMMRGVIYGINPAAQVIDLTHGIGPQDLRHGAVVLARFLPILPYADSIFVAVVDPGVGTDRDAILLQTPDASFVAPDNGLLTLVCRQFEPSFGDAAESARSPLPAGCRAWRLTNPDYWQHPVSATFHGRDIFSPVAAHLSDWRTPRRSRRTRAKRRPNRFRNRRVTSHLPTPSAWSPTSPPTWTNGDTAARLPSPAIFADAFGNLGAPTPRPHHHRPARHQIGASDRWR